MTDETPTDAPVEPPAPETPYAEPDVPDAPPASGLQARILTEYGRFTATGALHVDGVLAFTEGAPVNMSHPRLIPGPWGTGWLEEHMVADRFPELPLPGQG